MPSPSPKKDIIDLTAEGDSSRRDVIEITDSDDDEDLKAAIALSLQHDEPEHPGRGSPLQSDNRNTSGDSLPPLLGAPKKDGQDGTKQEFTLGSSNKFLVVDRKQMEIDRLARLKRKRESDQQDKAASQGNSYQPSSAHAAINYTSRDETPQERNGPTFITRVASKVTQDITKPISEEPEFSTGRILLTSTKKEPFSLLSHTQSFISMPELLKPIDQDRPLQSALLCAFNVDFDWLLPMLDTKSVSFVLVLHGANVSHRAALKQDFDGISNVRLVFPYIGGFVNCMHSKLMLLFYEEKRNSTGISQGRGRCRLVLPTANLIAPDWGVAGVMENAVFIIDLPEKSTDLKESSRQDTKTDIESVPTFADEFKSMLRKMGVPHEVLTKLNRYDFAATSKYRLVHTLGGSHQLRLDVEPQAASSTGLIGLSDTIASMGLAVDTSKEDAIPKVDYITSSLGNLTLKFVSNLLAAVCGRARLPFETKTTKTKNTSAAAGSDTHIVVNPTQLAKSLSIYFPSEQTVKASRGGAASAGMLLFNPKNLNATSKPPFLRECLRDCVGVRGDSILMHSKIMYVRFTQPRMLGRVETGPTTARPGTESRRLDAEAANLYAGWVYVGSANLSESAWGSIVQDAKTKKEKLNCRNWEAGIVIPVSVSVNVQNELDRGKSLHDLSLQEVFGHVVPVPIKEPAESYMDGREPWIAAI